MTLWVFRCQREYSYEYPNIGYKNGNCITWKCTTPHQHSFCVSLELKLAANFQTFFFVIWLALRIRQYTDSIIRTVFKTRHGKLWHWNLLDLCTKFGCTEVLGKTCGEPNVRSIDWLDTFRKMLVVVISSPPPPPPPPTMPRWKQYVFYRLFVCFASHPFNRDI